MTGVDHFMVGNRSPTWLCNRLWRVAGVKFATFKVSNSTNFGQCIMHTFFLSGTRQFTDFLKKYTKSWNSMPCECQHFDRLLSQDEKFSLTKVLLKDLKLYCLLRFSAISPIFSSNKLYKNFVALTELYNCIIRFIFYNS